MNAPCMICLKRKPYCHDSCGLYKEFKQDMDKEKDARNKFNYGRSVVIESSLRQTLSKMK